MLISNGSLRCWGDNDNGQLGIGGTNALDQSLPVAHAAVPVVAAFATGINHTCVRTSTSNEVWCWGDNLNGQIGDNTTTDRRAPRRVSNLPSAELLAAGGNTTCSGSTNAVYCWGQNNRGQIGDGTLAQRLLPVLVGGLTGATNIELGDAHACSLQIGGSRRCWGYDEFGQLGLGTPREFFVPQPISLPGAVLKIAGSDADYNGHACARLAGNDLYCWGENDVGQLGDGTNTPRATPAIVPSIAGRVIDFAAGRDTTCAILDDNTVSCWGENGEGQLGTGTTIDRNTPLVIPMLNGAIAIVAGPDFFCSRHLDGLARCWGNNSSGQLGTLNTVRQTRPAIVQNVLNPEELTAGSDHVCARFAGGLASCWGENSSGQIGINSTVDQLTPLPNPNLLNVVQIAAGQNHTCVRLLDQSVQCFGDNALGQMGNGQTADLLSPVTVSGVSGALDLSAGYNYNCARRASDVLCWGYALDGHFGTTPGTQSLRTATPAGFSGTLIEAVHGTTFVVSSTGAASVVGFVGFGQLGTGANLRPVRPIQAAF